MLEDTHACVEGNERSLACLTKPKPSSHVFRLCQRRWKRGVVPSAAPRDNNFSSRNFPNRNTPATPTCKSTGPSSTAIPVGLGRFCIRPRIKSRMLTRREGCEFDFLRLAPCSLSWNTVVSLGDDFPHPVLLVWQLLYLYCFPLGISAFFGFV